MANWPFRRRKRPLVSGLDEGGDQLGRADEADPIALGARLGGERGGQVGLSRSGVADHEDVLLLVDVLAAHELGDQHLVDRGPGGEVEGLERLDGRKARRFHPPFGGPLLAFEQFELGQAEQVGQVIGVVGGGLGGHLLALGRHRREAERLEMVVQEHADLVSVAFMML